MADQGLTDEQMAALEAQHGGAAPSDGLTDEQMAQLEAAHASSYPEVPDAPQEQTLPGVHGRFTVKNLSTAPTEGDDQNLNYLKAQNPGLEFAHHEGRAIYRKPGDASWYTLAPQVQSYSPTIHNLDAMTGEAADSLGTAAQVAAQTAGQIGGEVLGGLGMGPVGVLPGGMAGSGMAAGLTSGLKRALGKWAGVNPEIGGKDLAADTLSAAVAPAAQMGLGKAYNAAMTKVGPWIGTRLSNVPSDAIKTAYERFPELKQLDTNAVSDYAQNAYQKVVQPLKQILGQKGEELAAKIDATGSRVDLSQAKAPLLAQIQKYESVPEEVRTEPMKQALADAQDTYRRLFGIGGKEGVSIWDLMAGKPQAEQDAIVSSAKLRTVKGELGAENAGEQAYLGKPNYSTVDFRTNEIPDSVSARQAWDLQRQLAYENEMYQKPTFLQAINQMMTRSSQPDQSLIRGVTGAYNAIGDGLEKATTTAGDPNSSATLKAQYAQLRNTLARLNPYFRDDKMSTRALQNMDGAGYQALTTAMKTARDQGAPDITPEIQLLRAQKFLGKPVGYDGVSRALPWDPISRRGVSGMGRSALGGTLGYYGADQLYSTLATDNDALNFDEEPKDKQQTPGLIKGLGAAAGMSLSSPAAIRLGIQAVRKSEAIPRWLANKLGPEAAHALSSGAFQSAWTKMGGPQAHDSIEQLLNNNPPKASK